MIRHVAGEPVQDFQQCDRCRMVLVSWAPSTDPSVLAMYFRTGANVYHEGGTLSTAAWVTDAGDVTDCRPIDFQEDENGKETNRS